MSTNGKVVFLKQYPKNHERINLDNLTCPMIWIHVNGFPEAVLPVLARYLRTEGAKNRSNDYEYLSAYYLSYLVINEKGHDLHILNDYTNFGITSSETDAIYNYCVVADNEGFKIFVCDRTGKVTDIVDETYEGENL